MRPVMRGEHPTKDGVPVTFARYGESKPYLTERIGEYCSYCERRLDVSLAVEHVQPKDPMPQLELEWSNFLLGCTNCNSTKSAQLPAMDSVFWPDRDNTMRAFVYDESGQVRVNENLSAADQRRAKATLKLVGLDKKRPTITDERITDRRERWRLAKRSAYLLTQNDTAELRETIAELAGHSGFFSIWFNFFSNDFDMLKRIAKMHPGTAADCFDGGWRLLPRPGGIL